MDTPHAPQPSKPAPPFNPSAGHMLRPRLRPVRGFGAQQPDGKVLLGLSDARQISDQMVFVSPAVQAILPHMTGEKDIDAIVAEVGRGLSRAILENLIAQLDHAGLIEGPTFDAILSKMRAEFDSSPRLPPSSTAAIADALVVQEFGEKATDEQKKEHGARKLREALDGWIKQIMDQAADPSFDALPRAIIAPHLDYWRGWPNYAHVYGRMRVVDRPDRVVILGTNHFGLSTGVAACDKSFETPLGICEYDSAFADLVRENLGRDLAGKLFEHRYDHEREHSIELHIPWVQHIFKGPDGSYPKVFAALVHDPAPNNGESYDGNGLGILPFIDAMKAAITSAPGRTLIISSADLSHIGGSFGDQQTFAGDTDEAKAMRDRMHKHDMEMLQLVAEGKAEELVASMAWQQNPTRWCSTGNLVAAMKITGAKEVRMLNYMAAGDDQGVALVSSCAAAIA
ncbi:MAG TPA: AmmeMemoRadiSam system protein B [Phycisphaerales bacterium]|nr:AmmeMemoRadiSam system protein B [Phycisphaerales bacterium]